MLDAVAAEPGQVEQVGTMALGFPNVAYWLATVALTVVLTWGLRLLSKELQRPVGPGQGAGGSTPTLLRMALSEKAADTQGQAADKVDQGSFSRVAGAIGAVGIAATFVGMSYWILHTLFFDIGNLTKVKGLGTYFLTGSAMFFPYAFNQIASIFKT